MANFPCIRCKSIVGFNSQAELKQHIKEHYSKDFKAPSFKESEVITRGKTNDSVPTATPMPSNEEKTVTEVSKAQDLPSPKPIERKEITLEYKFIGIHETCCTEVKTLEMDIEVKHFVIAYCMLCNKQLISREVVNLKESEVKENEKKQDEQKKEIKKKK